MTKESDIKKILKKMDEHDREMLKRWENRKNWKNSIWNKEETQIFAVCLWIFLFGVGCIYKEA